MQYFVQNQLEDMSSFWQKKKKNKQTQNQKVKYPWFCYFFLQQIMNMKYTFSFFGAAWKGIIGEIKYCAFKVYFI